MNIVAHDVNKNADILGQEIELTILMPCLNEKATVTRCIEKAFRFLEVNSILGEVVIADNGSTDGSQFIASRAGARVVVVLRRGYGAAIIGGIAAAKGRFIIMGDADDSYDFEKLETMLEKLRGGTSLVMGNRFRGGIEPRAMPKLHRYLGNPVLSFVGRLLFSAPVGDFHCGLRGFSRDRILSLGLQCEGMEFASEMVVKASLGRLTIDEVPVRLAPDGRDRHPHLRTWRDGWRHLRFMLIHSPRWLFDYPGLLVVALALCAIAMRAATPSARMPSGIADPLSLAMSCLALMVGTQLLMFGALANQSIQTIILPHTRKAPFIQRLTLERIMFVACPVLVVSCAVMSQIVVSAMNDRPYSIATAIFSFFGMTLALQVIATGFFASILSLRARS